MKVKPYEKIVANCKMEAGDYNVANTINIDSCFWNEDGVLYAQLK
jgi:hypothetical protein